MKDLLKQQEELQKEANEVLNRLDLIAALEKYGKPFMVGSFALGLLTRRDIDIEVVVASLDKKQVQGICSYLVGLDHPRMDLTVMDNTVDKVPQLPNGYYVGVQYIPKEIPFVDRNPKSPLAWQIDIHFLTEENSKARAKVEEIKSKLTPDKRLSILEIKKEIATHPKYHRTVFSIDIYNAVLDQGINNLEEFKKYMKEKGVEL
jgi:hypothetical protein